jgi:hypothetical protein
LKNYLTTPPILQYATQVKPIILYLAMSAHALVALLAQKDNNSKEILVYYIRWNLIYYEKQYMMIEKQYLDLRFSTRKLRNYLLNAKIHVMMNFDPLKCLFNKTDLSRFLGKWVMLLKEFDHKFFSQKSIKGQVLTNQLFESPSPSALPSDDSFPHGNVLTVEMKTWEI